ncbi:LPXTG cell wall anchor domain-containing protein, partial [Streptococcus suis]
LNNTDRKKEVVEAILGAKLNPENARILAEDIAKDIKNANDLLGLVRGEPNDKANHLLALRHEIAQAREDAQKRLDWIIAPLKGLPDLNLDQGLSDLNLPSPSTNDRYRHLMNNGGSGLKDKLGGGLFQHDFASKPHIDPNQLIGKNTSGGILDGLFDDKGNLSLPDTGTVAKRTLLPVGIMIIALGACLIWKFRKKRK